MHVPHRPTDRPTDPTFFIAFPFSKFLIYDTVLWILGIKGNENINYINKTSVRKKRENETLQKFKRKNFILSSKLPILKMSYFRITLVRSAIGLPRRSTDVLKALGLKKRMATVFHPVSQSVAGQIMRVKELVEVREVDKALTKEEVHLERKPDPGYYVEKQSN